MTAKDAVGVTTEENIKDIVKGRYDACAERGGDFPFIADGGGGKSKADDIGWEAVTLKGEPAHRARLISISLSGQPSLCDNAPRAV